METWPVGGQRLSNRLWLLARLATVTIVTRMSNSAVVAFHSPARFLSQSTDKLATVGQSPTIVFRKYELQIFRTYYHSTHGQPISHSNSDFSERERMMSWYELQSNTAKLENKLVPKVRLTVTNAIRM